MMVNIKVPVLWIYRICLQYRALNVSITYDISVQSLVVTRVGLAEARARGETFNTRHDRRAEAPLIAQ